MSHKPGAPLQPTEKIQSPSCHLLTTTDRRPGVGGLLRWRFVLPQRSFLRTNHYLVRQQSALACAPPISSQGEQSHWLSARPHATLGIASRRSAALIGISYPQGHPHHTYMPRRRLKGGFFFCCCGGVCVWKWRAFVRSWAQTAGFQ